MMPSSQETTDLEEAPVSLGMSQVVAKKNLTGSLDNGEGKAIWMRGAFSNNGFLQREPKIRRPCRLLLALGTS
jgi:hypothetical protein